MNGLVQSLPTSPRPGASVVCSLALLVATLAVPAAAAPPLAGPAFAVSVDPALDPEPVQGRILLLLSKDAAEEPRFQVAAGVDAIQIFGVDVEELPPGEEAEIDTGVFGYPVDSLANLPAGRYRAQAVLHRYETFHRADGHTVKLPMNRGAGQQWERAPGNLYSEPRWIDWDPAGEGEPVELRLTEEIPPVDPPEESEYVKHVRIRSELLSELWGRTATPSPTS